MRQKLEIRDNLGNHGYLEFEIPADPAERQTLRNRKTILTAMEFSRMAGILETLGNVPDGCFQKHKLDILDWAKEFVENNGEDAVLFFEKKLDNVFWNNE